LRTLVSSHFPRSEYLGQHERRGGARGWLIFFDRFSLRHTVRDAIKGPARAITPTSEAEPGPASKSGWSPENRPAEVDRYVFSPWLYFQSGLILVVARN